MTVDAAMDASPIQAQRLPVDIAPPEPLIELPPCDPDAVSILRAELGLHPLAAQTLVRRGITDPGAVVDWLQGGEIHDPSLIPGGERAAARIAEHVQAGNRIAVHGDYDVDGASSTAILVRALAALGADVTWHVPSRFEDGYGLSARAVDRLAGDGAQLIVTVDCGIGSVAEVDHARTLGVDVVICDHHTIGEVLPDAPIVHPGLGEYPTPFLCAAATTHKLAHLVVRRCGGDESLLDDDLGLVALATVCDVVPLTGENRALVRQGLEALRRTLRPGLRELMRVAGVDQLKLDSASLGFALGPRINAAGRMYSAEPSVELMLTTSEARAAELAATLNSANGRRREVEQGILFEAERQAAEQRDQFAIVVAGADWHPGVLGIVAGRLAERYRRPAIALAIEGGVASGSGRGGGVYDLLGGLEACSELLVRFGGHKAAAGLELDESALPAFRRQFTAHAAASLTEDDLRPRVRIDAIAEPADVTLATIEELAALGPFGSGNRDPQVLIPAVALIGAKRMGKSGQHFKLSIAGQGSRTGVVAFNQDHVINASEDGALHDFVVDLSRNEFRGTVEPQAILRTMSRHEPVVVADAWNDEFCAVLAQEAFKSEGGGLDPDSASDRRGESPLSVLLSLEDPANTLLVANDPLFWRPILDALAATRPGLERLKLRAYDDDSPLPSEINHVVLAEPPPAPAFAAFGDTLVTFAWTAAGERHIQSRADELLLGRTQMVTAYRAVRDNADDPIAALKAQLPNPRIAARAATALAELSLLRVDPATGTVESINADPNAKIDLELSFTFRSYSEYREASAQWLPQLNTQTQRQ